MNGSFLGPTLRLRTGQAVAVTVTNAVDELTTMHWHGMLLPAVMDGGPHHPIEPGRSWTASWTVENPASTLWYHPHPHGATARQVFSGVAGLIIVDDEQTDTVGLPREYGVDDIPCILMDRTIGADGEMPFDTQPNFGQMGTDVLVNGTLGAYVELARAAARFRVLNASNARMYNLGFSDDRGFDLVATDQGYVPEPVHLERLALGPGERAEIVVRFRPGERVRMTTVSGSERVDEGDLTILEVRVSRAAEPVTSRRPGPSGASPLQPAPGAVTRRFALQGHDEINGREMDLSRIDEVLPAGALEVWQIHNTVYAHNFHVHGCELTVLDRDGKVPHPWEAGRKDTVHVPARSTVRVAVQVGRHVDPGNPYVYHCHILRHEDAGMMGHFVVVEPGTESHVSRNLKVEAHHH